MRYNMVKNQVMPEEVTHPVLLDALLKVPREWFVPRQLTRIAYMDNDFPLQQGRLLLRPATLARLIQAASLETLDKVLYIASGTGYGPALLGQMGMHVIALDSEDFFTQTSERLIQDFHLSSVGVVLGNLSTGWKKEAPYDKIIIEGRVDFIPNTLKEQLKEGGAILTFGYHKKQRLSALRYIKENGELSITSLFDAFAPRLEAFCKHKTFVF